MTRGSIREYTEAKRQELAAMYYGLNPVSLLKQINENLECLWKLAEHPVHHEGIIPRPQTDLLSSKASHRGWQALVLTGSYHRLDLPF